MSTVIYNGNFVVADTTVNATPGSTATSTTGLWDAVTVGTQGVWIDSQGSAANVSSHRGVINDGFIGHCAKRPSGDAARDQSIQVVLSAGSVNSNAFLYLRNSASSPSASGPGYICELEYGGQVKFYGYNFAQLGSTQTFSALDATKTCTLTFSAVGTTQVTLTAVVVQNGTTVGTFTVTDTSPVTALQGAGVAGIAANQTVYVDSVIITNIATGTISVSPTTGTTGSSGTHTVSGSGTSFSGNTFTLTNSGSTNASITSQSVTNNTSGTVTINYGSNTGTITIGDTSGSDTGATITLSAPASLTAGLLSMSPATASMVYLSSTSPAGGTPPVTQQWYRGTTSDFTPGSGNILSGQTSLTLTDTPPTSGVYWYALKYTDSASSPQSAYATTSGIGYSFVSGVSATPTPASVWAPPVVVYEIGDSITYYGSSYTSYSASIIKYAPGAPRTVGYYANGLSGTTTMDWLPNGYPRSTNTGYLASAISAMISVATTHVSIRLGANNLKTSHNSTNGPLTPATQWLADIVTIGTYIRSQFTASSLTPPSILVHAPSYIVPNVNVGGVAEWDDYSDALNQAYNALIVAGGIGTGFYAGDTSAYLWFANNVAEMDSAGVHHTAQGYIDHASLIGTAFVKAFFGSSGSGSSVFNVLGNSFIKGNS